MVQIIKKPIVKTINQRFYQCEECGHEYRSKTWAEKCEAWCREHGSSNIEITAHAVSIERKADLVSTLNNKTEVEPKKPDNKFLTRLFYASIGVAASLAFFLLLYWSLRLNSSIGMLIRNTQDKPLYLWSYAVLTVAAIALFGINASLFVHRWRKFGPPKIKNQGAIGAGSLVGVAASACPACGSVLLSAIGIAGGLAAFPLGGLELKALSVGLLALPIWLTKREMKKFERGDGANCPVPRDASFKDTDCPRLLQLSFLIFVMLVAGWKMMKTDPAVASLLGPSLLNPNDNRLYNINTSARDNKLFNEVIAEVLPEQGFQSKLYLGEAISKLVENGAIDRTKFEAIYKNRGQFPPELRNVLDQPSNQPILLTRTNANYYVNLLWPLGLANYMSTNKASPVLGKSLFNFASTGGWNLGKEENGGAYFNKFEIVKLTSQQEALATKIARNTYRPCCNNSTFFQDCNHGSALLGLLELGASQGLSEEELYHEALAFNSFWFPNNYIQTALYFKVVKNTDWKAVDPKIVMDKDYSSISGWIANVSKEIERLNLVPLKQGPSGCGV